MKHIAMTMLAATALTAPALSAPATAAEVRATMGTIITAPAGPDEINAKCDAYMAEIDARMAALVQASGPASITSTLVHFDQMTALISAGQGEFSLYQQVMGTQELRDAGGACQVRLATVQSTIGLSRPIYDQLAAIDASGADAMTRFYLSEILTGYERSGVALPDEPRARVQAINEELSQLSTTFARNIAEDVRELQVRPEELEGLPADFIAARVPGEDGLITLTSASTDYQPVMRYAASDDLRRRFSELYNARAYPQNDAVLRQIFTLRQELAGLLGRPGLRHAGAGRQDAGHARTGGSADRRNGRDCPARWRRAIWNATWRCCRTLRPGAERIEYWQTGWLSPKVQAALFDYNPQEARQYFAYDRVNDGILRLTEQLFGVEIRAMGYAGVARRCAGL